MKEGSGWGTHVYLWQIHFDIWQNQYNMVKFKNKIKFKKKNKSPTFEKEFLIINFKQYSLLSLAETLKGLAMGGSPLNGERH